MSFGKYILFSCILILKYQLCHSKCDNYYILMERYMDEDFGIEQYRPFVKGHKNWTVTVSPGGKEDLDMNCVLDLSCSTTTKIITRPKPAYIKGYDARFRITTPKVIPTTENIPTTAYVPTTEYIPPSMAEPTSTTKLIPTTNLPTTESTNIPDLTGTEIYENETEIITAYIPTTDSNKLEIVANNHNTTGSFTSSTNNPHVTDKVSPINNSVTESTTEFNNMTIVDGKNQTNSTNGALLQTDPEKNKLLAKRVIAGVLGTAATGAVIFGAKMLIQQYLQSGVYRLPDS